MIEAPRTGLNVRIVDVYETPDAIRRILPEAAVGTTVSRPRRRGRWRVPSTCRTPTCSTSAAPTYGVSPTLLAAVARQESGFDPQAVSPAGAQGLMQLMPGTAAGLGVTTPSTRRRPSTARPGCSSDLLDRFGSTELALAAYNAGPGAVLRYDGIPPYPRPRTTSARIMATLEADMSGISMPAVPVAPVTPAGTAPAGDAAATSEPRRVRRPARRAAR